MNGIDVERDARGVVTVWLNNPRRRNALSNAMVIALGEELPRLAGDESVRAVVLRGRGGVFCSGRDLADLQALQAAPPDAVEAMYGHLQRMNEAIYHSPHPVIGVIEKYALGIGAMLATWTDIALAEDGALFGYPEVHHGITPYGAVPTLLNTLGQKAMMDLLLTGRRLRADEAARLGVITRAVPAERLEAEIEAVLTDLFRGSAAAIRKSKQFVRQCETLGYAQAIALATEKHIAGIRMPEMRAGVAAFVEQRKT
jgi:enoyl-CoA hydratase/carnithine racemase